LEEVEQVEMVMAQIPTKALYRIHASVMQEVKSKAYADATKLEVGRGVVKMIQITCDQLTMEKEEEEECANKLEHGLNTVYVHIQNSVKALKKSAEEKINLISEKIDQYKQEIENLKERINSTTLPEVLEQRKKEYALQIVEMEKQVRES
jgi:hypothetical protein